MELSLYFHLTYPQCSTSICHTNDGQTEFSQEFDFIILSHLRNLPKSDARENVLSSKFQTHGHILCNLRSDITTVNI